DVAGGHLVGQVRLEDVAVVRGGAGVHQAVQIGLGDRHGVGGVAAGQVGVDADFSVIDHGEGRGRAGVVRGVDADLTEIEGLGGVVARIVGAVGRDRARHGEAGAVRQSGRAVVVHGVADGVPGRDDRAAVAGIDGVQLGRDVQ